MKDPQRSALLLIDLQTGIFSGRGGADQAGADRRLEDLCQRLSGVARRWLSQDRILILVQHSGPPDHRLAVGGSGWALRPEIGFPEAVVVPKTECDAFHSTPLSELLTALKVDTLVIGGCMTEYCIDTTCRSAVSRGYDVRLLEDGHATVDGVIPADLIIAHHNATLNGLEAGGATVRLSRCADV